MNKYKPLVNMNEMLKKAAANRYAVAQININNYEWTKAVLNAAQESNTPVILGVSEGAAKYMSGFKLIADMVRNYMIFNKITVPVALHLDHGSFEGAKAAIEAGFSSVMFDGSHLSFEDNIKKTKEILAIAKENDVSVEVEVGAIGGEEDGVTGCGELADVNQCYEISRLNISCLAAGIGNIHGIYPSNWKGLNFERLEEIRTKCGGIPLVLHGGTGIPEEQIKKAISLGVAKINVNTECQLAFAEATRKYIEQEKDLDKKAKGFDPRKLLAPGTEAIKKTSLEKFKIFGSLNKA